MSILSSLLSGKITVAKALSLVEVWTGQELAKIPGGQFIENFLNDLAGTGTAAASAPIIAAAKAIEAPVDAFLVAGLGPAGQTAEADFDSAVDAQANYLVAQVQLQAANLKQNLALGFQQG